MNIQLLDEILINKIAAGEVIERPGSVVKELVENSIDAGSTIINVKTENGGLKSISVEDNGIGIEPDELELAFMRHATSKISSETDLFNIQTMGFRGEALPSIASIAKVKITTGHRPPAGVKAEFDAGQKKSLAPCPFTQGTLLVVEDLFYNTPARLKYQKSPVSENMYIYDTMLRLALSRPDISISFANDKRKYFTTPGNGSLEDTVLAIYGSDYLAQLLPLEYRSENINLTGLVSRPEYKRVNRKNQFFYINGRHIFSPMIARAVDEAYRGFLVSREFPAVILFLRINFQDVDINVHPQKHQVRLTDDRAVFSVVQKSIRGTLDKLSYHSTPSIAFTPSAGTPPFNQASRLSFLTGTRTLLNTDLSDTKEHSPRNTFYPETASPETFDMQTGELKETTTSMEHDFIIIGQLFGTYIIVEKQEKLWLIDQHAAHERINYIRNREKLARTEYTSQPLMMPVSISLSNAEIELLESHSELLKKLGFEIDLLTPGSIAVRSVPTYVQGSENELLLRIIELIKAERIEELQEEIIIMAACKQSIKAGDYMSVQEMYRLVAELVTVENFWHCPHGRPAIIEISRSDLERRFKR